MDRRLVHGALATPLSGEGFQWASLSVEDRLGARRGRVELGVDVSGLLHAQGDSDGVGEGRGARGTLLPVLSTSLGPLVTELRSGVSIYRGRVDGEGWARELHVSDLTVVRPLRPAAELAGEIRNVRTGDEAYTFVGASGSGALGRGGVWGSVGTWASGLPEGTPATAWSAGASISLGGATDVWAMVRREPFDPLFLGSARTGWGVGASHRLGRRRARPPAAGAEHRARGKTVLRIPLVEASRPPSVAGDFSGWEPLPMDRYGTHWRVELALEPGVYHFAFRDAEGGWFVPESVPNRREDGMGGWVAVLIVSPEGSGRW